MKRALLYACFLAFLTTSACSSSKFISLTPNIIVGRVASEETRFPSEDLCTVAAVGYQQGQGNSGKPTSVSTTRLLYSFRKGNGFRKKSEIRYVVRTGVPATGQQMPYYEIPLVSFTDDAANGAAITNFINELISLGEVRIVENALKDEEVNSKRAWRAVLHTDNVLGDKTNKALQITGDFGIIINPPYPP